MKNDYRKKSKEELLETLKKMRDDMSAKVTSMYQGKEKNVKVLNPMRKEIARVLTVLKEKEGLGE